MPEPQELNCCPDGVDPIVKMEATLRCRRTNDLHKFHLLLPDRWLSTLLQNMREHLSYREWDYQGAVEVWCDDF